MMNMLTNRTHIIALLSLLALCSPTQAADKLSNAARAIDAEVIDAGDYYLGLDGKPIRFKRKKDVFLKLDSIKRARQQKHQGNNATGQNTRNAALRTLTPGFSQVSNHRWGALEIVKANQTQSGFSTRRQVAQQSANPAGLAPVFTSENGRGEYLILPDIMISFNSKQAMLLHQQAMLSQFGMHVKTQMMFSDTNFVLAFDAPVTDYRQVFSTTRDLMALPYIDWAEPNMQVKLKKTAVPNDYLFREQWGLYSWGLNGEFCDDSTDVAADIDANDAWDLMSDIEPVTGLGPTPIIAIIDDGVNLTHPDLQIWTNSSPSTGIPGGSDGINGSATGNFCFNDINGCNFAVYDDSVFAPARAYNISDANDLQTTAPPEPADINDTHGTQAAGIAAAKRDNSIGIAGSAYDAEILPIRLDFYESSTDCIALYDALAYAAKYADIISNSWVLDSGDQGNPYSDPYNPIPPPTTAPCKSLLDRQLDLIITGTSGPLSIGNTVFKRGVNRTPVLFPSGNSGAGWQKVSINIPSANSTVQFTFHKDFSFEDIAEDAVWLDDIQLPGSAIENIGASMPTSDWTISNIGTNNTAGAGEDIYSGCTAIPSAAVPVPASGNHALGGTGHAIKLDGASPFGEDCQYLEIANVSPGTLTFWVWVSAETWDKNGASAVYGELFRTYVNGAKTGMDLITRNTQIRGINNEASVYHDELAYPASHPEVIAVGASNNGSDSKDLYGTEDRAYFSQYGPTLDVVAPGTAIRSTTSAGGYGYLSGTSASTPMVAGIIANMLAVNPDLSLADIKTHLQNGADKIGPNAGEFAYSPDFNKYYGHGRVNSYKSTYLAAATAVAGHDLSGFPIPPLAPPETCEDPNPGAAEDDFWLLVLPAILAGAKQN